MLRGERSIPGQALSRSGRVAVGVCFAALLVAGPASHQDSERSPVDLDQRAAKYLSEVRYLSSPELRGRETGSDELDQAAHHIAHKFRKIGLSSLSGKSYLQTFHVTSGGTLGPHNRFEYTLGGATEHLKLAEDYLPLNFSGSGLAAAPVVFAGYGITAPECGYDDFSNIDVGGKIVLVLRHEPQEFDARSVFDGKVYTQHSQLTTKAENARRHGAVAVLIVSDTANHGSEEALDRLGPDVSPARAGIPLLQIRANLVEQWFDSSGHSFRGTQDEIDRDLRSHSFEFGPRLRVSLRVDVQSDQGTSYNVIGYLPGQTSEYIVLGAHYDHLGLGGQFSLAKDGQGIVHPGADDNASGTAGLSEIAEQLASLPQQKRGVLFIAFAGEEIGLVGSSYYVDHPLLRLADAVAMINIDMVGRIRNGKVYVGGADTGSGIRATLDSVPNPDHFRLDTTDEANYGSSDHTSFTAHQIPALFFFSGLHEDYHRPSDTWEKIDAPESVKLMDLIERLIIRLSLSTERPTFQPKPYSTPGAP